MKKQKRNNSRTSERKLALTREIVQQLGAVRGGTYCWEINPDFPPCGNPVYSA